MQNGEKGRVATPQMPTATMQAATAISGPRLSRSAMLLAIVSGALQVLIYPLTSWTFLCWIALAPLLVAIFRPGGPRQVGVRPWHGFLLGYVSGLMWSFGSCYWIYHVMHSYGGLDSITSFGVLLLFGLALAVVFGVFGWLMSLLARSRLGLRALFLAPFIWVPLEIVRGAPFDFPWNPLGTVLVDNIPLSRIAAATGVYGLSFEIVLVNTAFAAAFLVQRSRRAQVLVTAVLVAVLLQIGAFFQPPAVPAENTARLVQSDVPILDAPWTPEYFQETLQALRDLSVPRGGELNPNGPAPNLVVWPESPAPFFVTDPAFRTAVSDVAHQSHASMVVGSLGVPNGSQPVSQLYNSAALIAPNGDWAARYDKIHLVPFGEYVPFAKLLRFASKLTREVGDFVPGTQRKPLSTGSHQLGVFICYEAVYPDEVRQFAKNGAQVFVNISNDGWFGDTAAPMQHLNQARMRAIENRRWLLRATNTGITAAIDPYGRVLEQAPRNVRTYLDAPYGTVSGTTFYTRHGNWFVWLCAIISLASFIVAAIARRRPAQ